MTQHLLPIRIVPHAAISHGHAMLDQLLTKVRLLPVLSYDPSNIT